MRAEVLENVDEYIEELFANEDEALAEARRHLVRQGMPDYSISVNQGRLLQTLAIAAGARRILEIGTLGGYSTIWLARALPPDGTLVTLELEEKHAEVAAENIKRAGVANRVQIRVGPALDTLRLLVQEKTDPFDMVFIDADKPPYPEYLEWSLKLTRPGSLILADNVVRGGDVLSDPPMDDVIKGVQKFNKALAENGTLTSTILQTVGAKGHDGIAVAVVNR
jgi:caffeoyl-CoA O-methyltransferase